MARCVIASMRPNINAPVIIANTARPESERRERPTIKTASWRQRGGNWARKGQQLERKTTKAGRDGEAGRENKAAKRWRRNGSEGEKTRNRRRRHSSALKGGAEEGGTQHDARDDETLTRKTAGEARRADGKSGKQRTTSTRLRDETLRNGSDASWSTGSRSRSSTPGATTDRNSFVTDLPVGPTIVELAACGRARWKIENETFNVLKNKGYNLSTASDTGRKISQHPGELELLAFAIDTCATSATTLAHGTGKARATL